MIGQGFGCCKPAELLTCFRGCDLNGDCFPLALPGQSCRGDADCATDKCRGADTGNGYVYVLFFARAFENDSFEYIFLIFSVNLKKYQQ